MTEHELFLDSHKELTGLIRWMNKPIILVEKGSVDARAFFDGASEGDIIFTHDNSGITTLRGGFQEDLVRKIVETFLESHRKLQ